MRLCVYISILAEGNMLIFFFIYIWRFRTQKYFRIFVNRFFFTRFIFILYKHLFSSVNKQCAFIANKTVLFLLFALLYACKCVFPLGNQFVYLPAHKRWFVSRLVEHVPLRNVWGGVRIKYYSAPPFRDVRDGPWPSPFCAMRWLLYGLTDPCNWADMI